METAFLLFGAGLLAGAMNALAGGGSFVALPALILAGVPSVAANASSAVALYPGGIASAFVYRNGLVRIGGISIRRTFVATVSGGLVGALLLLSTPASLFDHVLPWLLLVATLMLWFGRRLGPALRRHVRVGPKLVLGVQFLLGLYGGYFGGAVGLMMMAAWTILDGADVATLNAPRTMMVSAANGIAILCFILAGAVFWRDALFVGAGAIIGGFGGAHVGRRIDPAILRVGTLLISALITAAFFLRG